MAKQTTLKKIGGSAAVVLPKAMLERLDLEAGDEVSVVETPDGILISPYDADFAEAMAAYDVIAKRYRNALRELAR